MTGSQVKQRCKETAVASWAGGRVFTTVM